MAAYQATPEIRDRVSDTFVLANEHGLHARPATMLARAAMQFEAEITISSNGRNADGKSLFSLLTLGAHSGSHLTVSACGPQAKSALQRLSQVITHDLLLS